MTDPAEPIDPAEPTQTTIKRFLCRHIHTSGSRCGSPALRGESFCYYHHTTRRPAPRQRGVHPEHAIFELPAIDDRAGIQFALAQVLARVATDQLDHKRSGRLLHGLFVASRNLPRDPRPDSRTSSRNDSRSYVCRSPRDSDSSSSAAQDNPPDDLVEDLILDPDLGPIAPIAEIPTPEAAAAAAQAAHAATRAAARESMLTAFALFQQENGFSSQPPDPNPTPSPSSLSSRSVAEGPASPPTVIPQPAQPEAVLPTEAADGTFVRRAAGFPGERSLLAGVEAGFPGERSLLAGVGAGFPGERSLLAGVGAAAPPHSSLLIAQSPQPIAEPQPHSPLTPGPSPHFLPSLRPALPAPNETAPHLFEEMRGGCTLNPFNPL